MANAAVSQLAGENPPKRPNDKGRSNFLGKWFSKFAHAVAHASGTPAAFLLAALTIVVWGVSGPIFHYSDTWQLVINTGTTIVTFLMVFLIQNTQNRDTLALQLKLSELIIAMRGVKNSVATIEDLPEDELEDLHKDLCHRVGIAREELTERRRERPDRPSDKAGQAK